MDLSCSVRPSGCLRGSQGRSPSGSLLISRWTRGDARCSLILNDDLLRSRSDARGSLVVRPSIAKGSNEIASLANDYCSEFVCESSPQIEQTIRSYMKDLTDLKTTASLYQPKNVDYSDGFRSVSSSGNVKVIRGCTMKWIKARLREPKTKIKGVVMATKSRAVITWELSGSVSGGASVDVLLTTTIELHQLTGRITQIQETCVTGLMSPASTAVFTGSRFAWAASMASLDVQEEMGKYADQLSASLDSLTSMDDSDPASGAYRDPTDPTKFFQNNQQAQQKSDVITFILIVSALWAVYKGFGSILEL